MLPKYRTDSANKSISNCHDSCSSVQGDPPSETDDTPKKQFRGKEKLLQPLAFGAGKGFPITPCLGKKPLHGYQSVNEMLRLHSIIFGFISEKVLCGL